MSTSTAPTAPLHLIIGTYTGTPDDIARVTPQHRAWLDGYYRSGTLLVSGRQNPPVGGVMLARGSSVQALHEMMQDDPFTLAGLATYQIIEFTPVKRAADFPLPGVAAVE